MNTYLERFHLEDFPTGKRMLLWSHHFEIAVCVKNIEIVEAWPS